MACGFVTLLLLYSPALLLPPSFVPHFLSSLIFLPPATQAIIQKATCMQQFTKWLLLPTLLWLYVKSSGTVHVRSKHPLVHENTSSATTGELWINRCLCLVFKNYTSMHDYSVLTSRARVSLQTPGQTLWVHRSRAGSAAWAGSSVSAQRAQCAPPAPTIRPTHRMSASVSTTAQNTSVWFHPRAARPRPWRLLFPL